MSSEIMQFIDVETSRIVESIAEKLRMQYEEIISINEIEVDDFERTDSTTNLDVVNYIKKTLNHKPLKIINEIFVDICKEELEIDFQFSNVQEIHEDNYLVKIEIELNQFSVLTKVEYQDLQIYSDDNDEISKDVCSADIKITNINYFTGKIQLEGTFKIKHYATDFYVIDSLVKKIHLKVAGIKSSYSKQWFENIVHGALYYELGNLRMAYFNTFSGLDEFINLVYDKLFDIYVDEYSRAIKEISDLLFDHIKEDLIDKDVQELFKEETKDLGGELDRDSKIQILVKHFPEYNEDDTDSIDEYFDELYSDCQRRIEDYYNSYAGYSVINEQVCTEQTENILKERIRKYSNTSIRLREKIRECSDVIGMRKPKNHQNEFKNYYELLKSFETIENNRNSIAHGRKLENLQVDDLLYFSLTLILSLCLNCDFERRGWNQYININYNSLSEENI